MINKYFKLWKKSSTILYERKDRSYVMKFIFFSITILIFNIIEPLIAGKLAYNWELYINWEEIIAVGLFWGLVFILKSTLEYFYQKLKNSFKLKILSVVHKKLINHNLNISLEQMEYYQPGYLIARQTEDVEDIDGILYYSIIDGMVAWIQLVLISIIMLYLNLCLGIVCILLIFLNIIMNFTFPLKKLYASHNEKRAFYKSSVYEAYLGIQQIKLSNKEKYELDRISENIEMYFKARKKRDDIDIIRKNSTGIIDSLYFPILIIGGAYFAYKGMIEFNTVISFLLFYQKINSSVVPAINFIPLLKIGFCSFERIVELLELPEEKDLGICHGLNISNIQSISFKNVSFSYEDKTIIRQINMEFNKGELAAIVGISGSEKSTIVKLILQLIHQDGGTIYINDIDIENCSKRELRKNVSIVTQENFLFNRTIEENLKYSNEQVSKEQMWNVLRMCGLEQTVKNMEKGIDSVVGQLGNKLSGGEKQRLCIAREILKDASVYIFDEATSALDAYNEKAVNSIIKQLAREKLVIIITHKLSGLENVGQIYVLENQKIVESGTHENLLMKKGVYSKMYMEGNDYIGAI